jgi:hypothetical protein
MYSDRDIERQKENRKTGGETNSETYVANFRSVAGRDFRENSDHEPRIGFYEYYQISLDDDNDDDESEEFGPGRRELKGRMDGLHSPWGTIGRIKSERGYTHEYVLWGEAWINLLMETADAPRYTRKKHTPIIESAEELDKIFGKKQL